MSTTTRARRARKMHRCDSCRQLIRPGAVYLVHTVFPGHDVIPVVCPAQSKECAGCATRYGRILQLAGDGR